MKGTWSNIDQDLPRLVTQSEAAPRIVEVYERYLHASLQGHPRSGELSLGAFDWRLRHRRTVHGVNLLDSNSRYGLNLGQTARKSTSKL